MKEIIIMFGVVAFILGAIGFALTKDITERAELRAHYEQCEYLGTRIEKGWGSIKIWRYNCDGVIEESTLKPSR